MLRLIRPALVVAVAVLAGIWLFDTGRELLSSVGFYLFLGLAALLLVGRRHRRPT